MTRSRNSRRDGDLEGIANLSPAVTESTAPNARQLNINGAFAYDNLFMINGVDVNDNLFGSPQNVFIEDAIQETQVLTSGISAEYGRFSGGVINAITKSGGNKFTGSFRLNLADPTWSAITPFEQDHDTTRTSVLNKTYEVTLGGRSCPTSSGSSPPAVSRNRRRRTPFRRRESSTTRSATTSAAR